MYFCVFRVNSLIKFAMQKLNVYNITQFIMYIL